MKKFCMALVAISLLASCSKETPELQPKQVEQDASGSITAVAPNTPGAIRLTLDADLDPDVESFKVAQESFSGEDDQTARGAEIHVGGPNINSAIKYKITPGADGTVPALVYLYDNARTVSFEAKAKVNADGKGVKLDLGLVLDPTSPSGIAAKTIVDNDFANAKLACIIGYDKSKVNGRYVFTNKGPQLITYKAGQTHELKDNFIMLKAKNIPLTYNKTSREVKVANNAKVSLSMQGYLIGARFRNIFPDKVYRYEWKKPLSNTPYPVDKFGNKKHSWRDAQELKRPPIGLVFRIDNLSATYQTKIGYSRADNEFEIGTDVARTAANIMAKRVTTPGLEVSTTRSPYQGGINPEHGTREHENFLDATNIGEFFVPVGSAPDPNKFAEGEKFVLVYCPNPHDMGSIGYKSPNKLFYDDSPFGQMTVSRRDFGTQNRYHALSNEKNAYRKRYDINKTDPTYTDAKARASVDNKFFFVTFTLESSYSEKSSSIWYDDGRRAERYDLYKAAYKKEFNIDWDRK